jgi:polyribonucleotide nucleotidyltransferase
VVKVGDKLRVEIADIDNRGKISLVLVSEDEETAAAASSGSTPVDATTGS